MFTKTILLVFLLSLLGCSQDKLTFHGHMYLTQHEMIAEYGEPDQTLFEDEKTMCYYVKLDEEYDPYFVWAITFKNNEVIASEWYTMVDHLYDVEDIMDQFLTSLTLSGYKSSFLYNTSVELVKDNFRAIVTTSGLVLKDGFLIHCLIVNRGKLS